MDPRTGTLVRKKPKGGGPEMLCPYGCGNKECDDRGYCRHLIGFTLDGRNMEVLERWGPDNSYLRHGKLVEPVLHSDIIVPRETPTSRVYRGAPGERPVLRQLSGGPDQDTAALVGMINNLQAQVADLQTQLGLRPAPATQDTGTLSSNEALK